MHQMASPQRTWSPNSMATLAVAAFLACRASAAMTFAGFIRFSHQLVSLGQQHLGGLVRPVDQDRLGLEVAGEGVHVAPRGPGRLKLAVSMGGKGDALEVLDALGDALLPVEAGIGQALLLGHGDGAV